MAGSQSQFYHSSLIFNFSHWLRQFNKSQKMQCVSSVKGLFTVSLHDHLFTGSDQKWWTCWYRCDCWWNNKISSARTHLSSRQLLRLQVTHPTHRSASSCIVLTQTLQRLSWNSLMRLMWIQNVSPALPQRESTSSSTNYPVYFDEGNLF